MRETGRGPPPIHELAHTIPLLFHPSPPRLGKLRIAAGPTAPHPRRPASRADEPAAGFQSLVPEEI
jgi:hypothetical protein